MSRIEKLNELAKQSSLFDLPIGVYVVTTDGNFVLCNQRGREILELPLNTALPDSIFHYYAPGEREKFLLLVERHLLRDTQQWVERLSRLQVNGQEKFVKEYTSAIVDPDTSTTIGYLCCMTDVTVEEQYAQKIGELTHDIGSVLHSYSAALVTMNNSIHAVLKSLGPDPFIQTPNLLTERASTELEGPSGHLANSVNTLINHLDLDSPDSLHEDRLRLRELAELLQNYQHRVPHPEAYPSLLRTAGFEILNILNRVSQINHPKEILRRTRKDAEEVLRICNLISLHQLLDLTTAMEHPIFTLREFLITGERDREARRPCKISHLISRAVSATNEFALSREVTVRYAKGSTDGSVMVVEHEVIRALTNLLHNAIKYSWRSKEGRQPLVSIRTHTVGSKLRIEIENRGVPIPKDEISEGLVFRIGFRGRFSGDRGRIGTGIGLADSRRVAKWHDGDVVIKSRPAISSSSEDDYEKPFLTTVIFILPLYQD